jgi:hypothetical protein
VARMGIILRVANSCNFKQERPYKRTTKQTSF